MTRTIDPPVTRASYFICCLARSGSWLLADALKTTGVAGVPEEYYWHQFHDDYLGHWGNPEFADFGGFLAQTLRVGTTANGVFGAKLHWAELGELETSLRSLPGTGGLATIDLLRRYFPDPKFVYLYRSDKVRQAISWYRAGATAGWYQVRGEAKRKVAPKPDWDRVLLLERTLRADEESWQRFFTAAGVTPVRLRYEDLVTDYSASVDRVLTGLGMRPPKGFTHPAPRLEKQRDGTTEEWVQRYLLARRTSWPTDDELYGPSLA